VVLCAWCEGRCLTSLILLEHRVLGYVHIRKGPNKFGFVGILQPFRDAINLLAPEFDI
jgi:NADH:ubiquinone oxidoreductase subunit H